MAIDCASREMSCSVTDQDSWNNYRMSTAPLTEIVKDVRAQTILQGTVTRHDPEPFVIPPLQFLPVLWGQVVILHGWSIMNALSRTSCAL